MSRRSILAITAAVVVVAAGVLIWRANAGEPPVRRAVAFTDVLPAPASASASPGVTFTIADGAAIVTQEGSPEAARIGDYLATVLGHGVATRPGTQRPDGGIALLLETSKAAGKASTPSEEYSVDINAAGVTVRAPSAVGLFWGVQTLRQLLPGDLSGPLVIPGGRIIDRPHFAYRGLMLDVARHFFGVADVKRVIDLAVLYKINYLHLHLSDDQGWRIAIDGWPRLTEYGGGSEVGGGPGGYYTKDDYRDIVAYAAQRFVTVVPEVDIPGHTTAALASYPELNCDGKPPPRHTGIEVGFSALCPHRDVTHQFLEAVFGQLADLTPGPYIHIGGDEAKVLKDEEYASIVGWAQDIVRAKGKTAIGWHDLGAAKPAETTVLQFWATTKDTTAIADALADGHKMIMSPANRAYLDQRYDSDSRIGLSWAGPITVEESYDWNPAGYLPDVKEGSILGVEGPLWTETVTTMNDIEYLLFPRLAAIAELGWSPTSTHDWAAFKARLGAQAPRWEALGVDFARIEGIPWVAQD